MLSSHDTELDSSATLIGDPERTSVADDAPAPGEHADVADRGPPPAPHLAATADAEPADFGLRRLGRYVLLRPIGAGAIGVVYAAYHEGLDRKLAIKLLNRQRAGRADLEARLRREAKALAKLSHPNVVQVYDVGDFDGRVFVAMEYVEGETLAAWLRRDPPLTAKLAMFAAAGRGLAAAHDAGVVHRDFKPDNVLVGHDGRPRVLDFGLARAAEPVTAEDHPRASPEPVVHDNPPTLDPDESVALVETQTLAPSAAPLALVSPRERAELAQDELAATEPSAKRASSSLIDEVVTRDGALLGTPAYMAPEQFVGERVGPAADQFSFCVALYEAIYGQRPFAGRSALELAVSTHDGALTLPPNDSEVPAWIRQALVRGLRPDPRERFASMHELLAELERPPAPQRRGWWLLAGVAATAILGVSLAVLVRSPDAAPVCPTVEQTAESLWNEADRRPIADAFARSGLPFAAAAWAGAEPRLQAWAERWAEQHVDACEATHVRKQFSTAVLDRREACLDRGRRAFEALTEQLAAGEAQVVERAVEAAAALPDPARCGEVELLLAAEQAPPDQREAVAEIRERLAALDTLADTGRGAAGLDAAREALAEARASGYGPVEAEALRVLGRLQAEAGDADQARRSLEDALDQAERSGHDELLPAVATELVSLSIYARPDPIRGRLWARRSLAALDRIDERGLARARGLRGLGNIERLDGRNAQAEASLREALALLDEHAPDHPDRALVLNDLGNALEAQGRLADARDRYQAALRESIAAFGPSHPRVGHAHYNLARVAIAEGRLDDADRQRMLAEAIYAGAHGPGHRDLGSLAVLAANIALIRGDNDAAERHARAAAAIYAVALAPDNVDRAEPELLLGHVAFARDQYDEALTHYRASLSLQRAALGPRHVALALTLTNLGLVHLSREEPDAAIELLVEALAVLEAGERINPEELAMAHNYLADALLARAAPGDAARAAIDLETAHGLTADSELQAALAARAAEAHAAAGDLDASARWVRRTRGSGGADAIDGD